jgi:putative acetyltransferase
MKIRPAKPRDNRPIRQVLRAAFGQKDEADLVERLRADGDAFIELVAEQEGYVVGHIVFSLLGLSPMRMGAPMLAALAPVAVWPDAQRRGVGRELVQEGLLECRTRGVEAVIVLGHYDYYPRFGFSAEAAAVLDAPFSGESFMALELAPGALARAEGRLLYAKAFGVA